MPENPRPQPDPRHQALVRKRCPLSWSSRGPGSEWTNSPNLVFLTSHDIFRESLQSLPYKANPSDGVLCPPPPRYGTQASYTTQAASRRPASPELYVFPRCPSHCTRQFFLNTNYRRASAPPTSGLRFAFLPALGPRQFLFI